jgi:hypothetical protein
MPDTAIARAEHSIHHVHELIQMVFSRPAAEAQTVLGGLMAVFAEDFSMVGIAGTVFDRQQVEQLFKRVAGARPGLGRNRRSAGRVASRHEYGGALQGGPAAAGRGAGSLGVGDTRMQ